MFYPNFFFQQSGESSNRGLFWRKNAFGITPIRPMERKVAEYDKEMVDQKAWRGNKKLKKPKVERNRRFQIWLICSNSVLIIVDKRLAAPEHSRPRCRRAIDEFTRIEVVAALSSASTGLATPHGHFLGIPSRLTSRWQGLPDTIASHDASSFAVVGRLPAIRVANDQFRHSVFSRVEMESPALHVTIELKAERGCGVDLEAYLSVVRVCYRGSGGLAHSGLPFAGRFGAGWPGWNVRGPFRSSVDMVVDRGIHAPHALLIGLDAVHLSLQGLHVWLATAMHVSVCFAAGLWNDCVLIGERFEVVMENLGLAPVGVIKVLVVDLGSALLLEIIAVVVVHPGLSSRLGAVVLAGHLAAAGLLWLKIGRRGLVHLRLATSGFLNHHFSLWSSIG